MYHGPNENRFPEKYAHYQLFHFYPFRSKRDLQAGSLLSYQAIKSAEEGVHDIFNFNRQNFQLYAELVDETYANHKKTMKQLKDHIR